MIRYKLQRLSWRLNGAVGRLGCRLVRWSERDSNYLKHIRSEWQFVFPESCEMQDLILENILDVAAAFAAAGHSGSSAPYTIRLIEKALAFEPFGPLTGADAEWGEPYDGEGCQQNKRCSHVFRDADGTSYDINGKVFVEPDGCAFSGRDSRVNVTFPYVPTTEYVQVAP